MMSLKHIILGLALSSSLSGETLQEFVSREGTRVGSFKDPNAHSIIYSPVFSEPKGNDISSFLKRKASRVSIALVKDPMLKEYLTAKKDISEDYSTMISVYSMGRDSADRLIIWDNKSDKRYDPLEDKIIFESKDPKRFKEILSLEEAESIFEHIYQLAEGLCGLIKEDKVKKHSANSMPTAS
jgi:hypothetical protein